MWENDEQGMLIQKEQAEVLCRLDCADLHQSGCTVFDQLYRPRCWQFQLQVTLG